MSQIFRLHPHNPQPRLVGQAVSLLRSGALVVYPTDSCYALGCTMDSREAQERIRRIRGLTESHFLTLACRDLSELAVFAKVDNSVFRLLRAHTPGPYTFVLRATRDVPRRLQDPKRRSIGLRVPTHPVAQALLEALGEPLMSATLRLADEPVPLSDPDDIEDRMRKHVDLIIESGSCGVEPTSVVDLAGERPRVLRRGLGATTAFEQAA
jgi:tRNA threonylcarbamoyl adenosine modification protein (Sua5/YciO/YrdC/YwlC family)